MNEDFLSYYAYWPNALPSDLDMDRCHSECFGSKSKPFSFGKSERDRNSTINMKIEEMCFIPKNKN